MTKKPTLFIKRGCPWCEDALEYFDKTQLDLEILDIRESSEAKEEMTRISGQGKVPTFVYGDFVVADFDLNEFAAALNKKPVVKAVLKL